MRTSILSEEKKKNRRKLVRLEEKHAKSPFEREIRREVSRLKKTTDEKESRWKKMRRKGAPLEEKRYAPLQLKPRFWGYSYLDVA